MGDAADMVLDGTLCEWCGVLVDYGASPGHPRKCDTCLRAAGKRVAPRRASGAVPYLGGFKPCAACHYPHKCASLGCAERGP